MAMATAELALKSKGGRAAGAGEAGGILGQVVTAWEGDTGTAAAPC